MPSVKHEDLILLVQRAWMSIDHKHVAEKGYKQTGPTMSMTGPVKPEEVYSDLLDVLKALDPDSTLDEVALNKVREDAIAFVHKGYYDEDKWKNWKDCWSLIEPHDDEDEGLEEGLEALGVVADHDDDAREEKPESDEDDDKEDQAGEDSDGAQPSIDDDDDDSDSKQSDDDSDHGHDGVGVEEASTVATAAVASGSEPQPDQVAAASQLSDSQPTSEIWDALQLLYKKAMKDQDDTALRFFRNQLREAEQAKEHGSLSSSVILRKRAREEHEESLRAGKRWQKEQRLEADQEKDRKNAEAKIEVARLEQANKKLALEQAKKERAEEQRLIKFRFKLNQTWLQTMFPAVLLDKCIHAYSLEKDMSRKKQFEREVRRYYNAGFFERHLIIHNLWQSDKTLTKHWHTTASFHKGGPRRSVQCGPEFERVISFYAPQEIHLRNVNTMLQDLLAQCVPLSSKIFTGHYGVMRLLHLNDYILEKTFVYCITCLSKWLGQKIFPSGIYGNWPPAAPAECIPADPEVVLVPCADEVSVTKM